MESKMKLTKFVEYAAKAPSGHNTQPWQFILNVNEIHIHPDMKRALPVVDSDNHALYISLGCATENLVIAANKYGFQTEVKISKTDKNEEFIQIKLMSAESVTKDELFDFIEIRQSTRNPYTSNNVALADISLLQSSFNFDGISVLTFTTPEEINALEPFIIDGSNLQFENEKFIAELVSWFRFSEKEAKEKGDGLWTASMGLPKMNRFIGNIVMKYFVSAKSEAKRWKELINASSGFALFVADKNDVRHWVTLGRAFQRFGLTATKLNISHAHVNMPCEELKVRKKLIQKLGIGSRHPLLLVRFGYSEKMPYSKRRNLDDVIKNN
jgi:hypothetical protein